MRDPIATAIAISVGLVILIGYFLPIPLFTVVQSTLLNWAVIIGAFAALVGIGNLILNHWRKLTSKNQRDFYSLFALLGFVGILGAGILLDGPMQKDIQQAVRSIVMPVEASLMAVLAITLGYACLRLLRQRRDALSILFIISTVFFLILSGGFLAGIDIPLVQSLTAFIDRLPIAGARGILLGIALGSLTTGLRILMGADRPYSG
jgi:hypothetical protein